MKKEFIPYEIAIELKELGFDEPCLAFYDGKNTESFYFNNLRDASGDYIPFQKHDRLKWFGAPLYQQAFKFFREKHNLLGNVYSNASGWLWEIHDNIGGTHRFGSEYSGDCEESGMFTSFDKAEQECLKKLIEIVKNK